MPDQTPEHRRFYDRFDLLFYVTLATVALLLLVDIKQEEGAAEVVSLAVTALTVATLLLAVAAAGIGRRGRRIAMIVLGLGVIAAISSLFVSNGSAGYGGFVWLLLVVSAPMIALRRLMQHETVTLETLLGAISVFLLIAISASYVFLFIDTVLDGSGRFFGQEEPTTVFAYFSLVTITSLGYGDFAPAGEVGRAAAAWEAVIGQIYLVIVIARLVSLYGGRVRRSGDAGPPSAD